MSQYSETYFADNYRSYEAQNPRRKLDHYISQIDGMTEKRSPRVLDFGCGLGAFLKRASEARPGWKLFGSDINASAIAHLEKDHAIPIDVAVSDGSSNPFPDTQFDVITAFDVLEHLDEPGTVMERFAAWLEPGGAVIFVVPVYDGPLGPLVSALDKDPTHIQKRSREFWVELAQRNFHHVNWHGTIRYLLPTGQYLHMKTLRLRSMAPAIVVKGHKQAGVSG